MDYSKFALQFSRVINAFSAYISVCFLVDPEGSVIYPSEDYSRFGSGIGVLLCALFSVWLFRFAAKVEGSRSWIDCLIIFFAILIALDEYTTLFS